MAKQSNQKLKLYHLAKIMLENTDEQHHISAKTILQMLEAKDISCSRKTLYVDVQELKDLGIEVIGHRINNDYLY